MTADEIKQEMGDVLILRSLAWRAWERSGDPSDRDNRREAKEVWEWYTAAAQRYIDLLRDLMTLHDAQHPPA
jgi:hypothetical protein